MIRPLARRSFLLDSGALTQLAADDQRTALWLAHVATAYERAAVFVPYGVLTEALTGAHDAPDRRV